MKDAQKLIDRYDLDPHPEGGYYRRIHESSVEIPETALPDRYSGARRASSTILYLLTEDDVSKLHRLKSEETWHFYTGNVLSLYLFEPDNSYRCVQLGTDFSAGQFPNFTVPGGCWFGATVELRYAFVGCTVSPEFRFEDYEKARASELLERYPEATELIERLT